MRVIVIAICTLFVVHCVPAFGQKSAFSVLENSLNMRRGDLESGIWRISDFNISCEDYYSLKCWERKSGDDKIVAQKIIFHPSGFDRIWMSIVEPDRLAGNGIVIDVFPDNLIDSSRYFCDVFQSEGNGPREITSFMGDMKIIDSENINAPWIPILLQSGSEIFSQDMFSYQFMESKDEVREDAVIVVKYVPDDEEFPDRRVFLNKETHAIERVEYRDFEGDVMWILINKALRYEPDGRWSPQETWLINVKNDSATRLVRLEDQVGASWPGMSEEIEDILPCK